MPRQAPIKESNDDDVAIAFRKCVKSYKWRTRTYLLALLAWPSLASEEEKAAYAFVRCRPEKSDCRRTRTEKARFFKTTTDKTSIFIILLVSRVSAAVISAIIAAIKSTLRIMLVWRSVGGRRGVSRGGPRPRRNVAFTDHASEAQVEGLWLWLGRPPTAKPIPETWPEGVVKSRPSGPVALPRPRIRRPRRARS